MLKQTQFKFLKGDRVPFRAGRRALFPVKAGVTEVEYVKIYDYARLRYMPGVPGQERDDRRVDFGPEDVVWANEEDIQTESQEFLAPIGATMEEQEGRASARHEEIAANKRLDSVARMMAAAYWRGKLDHIRPHSESGYEQNYRVFEAMIKAAAENQLEAWKPAARLALGE